MSKNLVSNKGGNVSERGIFTRAIILLGIVVLAAGIWGWWHLIYSSPERVFWGMINNSLSTTTVTRETIQKNHGQVLSQTVQTRMQPMQLARGQNEITQSGTGGFDVVTSILGTPTADYVRYDAINNDPANTGGKMQNYQPILNVWAKTDVPGNRTAGQLYNQAVLGVLPFGNLPLNQRKVLIKLMHDKTVFKTDYSSVARRIQHGRPVYTFDISVKPDAYVTMLKQYAAYVGLNHLDQTNPADYQGASALKFQFDVDVWTREIKTVHYANGREEHYSGFGNHALASSVPKNTISIDELQKRVQAAQ